MTFDDTFFFMNQHGSAQGSGIKGNDTLPGGKESGSDTFFFGWSSDGPVPEGTFGEPIPDPYPPIDPYGATDDTGSHSGPIGPAEPGDNGDSAEEADGNTLHPDYQPVEDVWILA